MTPIRVSYVVTGTYTHGNGGWRLSKPIPYRYDVFVDGEKIGRVQRFYRGSWGPFPLGKDSALEVFETRTKAAQYLISHMAPEGGTS